MHFSLSVGQGLSPIYRRTNKSCYLETSSSPTEIALWLLEADNMLQEHVLGDELPGCHPRRSTMQDLVISLVGQLLLLLSPCVPSQLNAFSESMGVGQKGSESCDWVFPLTHHPAEVLEMQEIEQNHILSTLDNRLPASVLSSSFSGCSSSNPSSVFPFQWLHGQSFDGHMLVQCQI